MSPRKAFRSILVSLLVALAASPGALGGETKPAKPSPTTKDSKKKKKDEGLDAATAAILDAIGKKTYKLADLGVKKAAFRGKITLVAKDPDEDPVPSMEGAIECFWDGSLETPRAIILVDDLTGNLKRGLAGQIFKEDLVEGMFSGTSPAAPNLKEEFADCRLAIRKKGNETTIEVLDGVTQHGMYSVTLNKEGLPVEALGRLAVKGPDGKMMVVGNSQASTRTEYVKFGQKYAVSRTCADVAEGGRAGNKVDVSFEFTEVEKYRVWSKATVLWKVMGTEMLITAAFKDYRFNDEVKDEEIAAAAKKREELESLKIQPPEPKAMPKKQEAPPAAPPKPDEEAGTKESPPEEDRPRPKVLKPEPKDSVTFDVKEKRLRDLLDFIGKRAGLKIEAAPEVEERKITLQLDRVDWLSALGLVARWTGCDFEFEGMQLVRLTPSKSQVPSYLLQELKDKEPSDRKEAAILLGQFLDREDPSSLFPNDVRLRAFPENPEAAGHITVDVRDKDVHEVLRFVSRIVGVNVLAGPEVRTKLTLQADRMEWRKFVDFVARQSRCKIFPMSERLILLAPAPSPEDAIPALVSALRDEDPEVREKAAWALGRIGDKAKAAIPGLEEAGKDKAAEVRREAATAIEKIKGPGPSPAAPAGEVSPPARGS